ncbi:hypothetical protein AB1Y20_000896 [Prymnesium parvum]|uniref:Uncharacterized protein n=1 Tax=Prymnesium parvum TaxID=97485 RepID=A0AB34K7Z7_PRYPA
MLLLLPPELLRCCLANLLPPEGFAAAAPAWRDVLTLASASTALHECLGEVLIETFESFASLVPSNPARHSCWRALIRSILTGHSTPWRLTRTLRAVRAIKPHRTPIQAAPPLSGASLCAMGEDQLVIFGGRDSATGETMGDTYFVTVLWTPPSSPGAQPRGTAQWDVLRTDGMMRQPPARCYHGAALWGDAVEPSMAMFGGAGEGSVLYSDAWVLRRNGVVNLPLLSSLSWGELSPTGKSPGGRSSLLCTSWTRPDGRALVVHGGIGECGVTSDLWVLPPQGSTWLEIETSGLRMARAHHCGGVVGDRLVVYSGQDAALLTVSTICTVNMYTGCWAEMAIESGPSSRIDAAAACVGSIGILVFGGVGSTFESMDPYDTWLVAAPPRSNSKLPVLMPRHISTSEAPCARACHAMCASGLHVYVFGGFDDVHDRNELLCLSLVPSCFKGEVPVRIAGNAEDFAEAEFRSRQARQVAVLHQTPAAAGHNTMHLRMLRQAMNELFIVDGSSSANVDEVGINPAVV